jgi:hypothetical protein
MESIQKEIDFGTNLSELPPEIVDSIINGMCNKENAGNKEYQNFLRKIAAEQAERYRQMNKSKHE